jgi:ribose transport system substrate-binding protein
MRPHDRATGLAVLALAVLAGGCARRPPGPPPAPAPPAKRTTHAGSPSVLPEAGGKLVGVSLRTRRTWFSREMEKGLNTLASRVNMRLDTQCAELDAALQARQIAAFVAEGVAAIIVVPVSSDRVGATLKAATDAGIPVVALDGAAPDVPVTCQVAMDNVAGGRLAAQEAARLAGGKGDVLVLDDPGPSASADRLAGFRQALARAPGLRVGPVVAAGVDRARAQEITAAQLRKHPGVSVVFALNDELALGANAACKAAGAQRHAVVVGCDGSPDAVAAILAGDPLGASIVLAGQAMGAAAVEAAVRAMAGESLKHAVSLAPEPVDRDTLRRESRPSPVT